MTKTITVLEEMCIYYTGIT